VTRPAAEGARVGRRTPVELGDWFLWVVIGLTIAGGVLRFTKLGQSYWYDEAVTVGLVRSSFYSMIRALPRSESTPPLYYGVAWVWARIFGTDEVALRSLSALFGTAAIPVAAAAGRAFVSRAGGALVGALVAASPFLVWYSQEGRAYALYVLLSAWSLLLFERARQSSSDSRLWLWAGVSALAVWTEYFAVFLVLAEAAFLLADRRSRHLSRRPMLVLAAAVALLVPLTYKQASTGHISWIALESPRGRAKDALSWFLGLPSHLWLVAAGVVVLAVVSASLASAEGRRSALVPLALAAAAILLPLGIRVVGKDYWLARNVIDAWVPFAIALAAVIICQAGRAWHTRAALAGLALTAVALLAFRSTTFVTDASKRADWRGLAVCLGRPDPARAFVISPAYNAIVLKLYRPDVRVPRPTDRGVTEIDVIGHADALVSRRFEPDGRICAQSIAVRRRRATAPVRIPQPTEQAGVLIDSAGP
jgi:mannosyltransferase